MTEQQHNRDSAVSTSPKPNILHSTERTAPTKGSKLGAIAGAVITLAFFMPWVRGCNMEVSGYEIATDTTGRIEQAWVYWACLLGGLVCVGLFFWMKTGERASRLRAAWMRLIAGILGGYPILNIWLNIREQPSAVDILYGFWLVTLGYVGVIVSFFVDRGEK